MEKAAFNRGPGQVVVSSVYGTDEATQKHQHHASYQSPLKDHVPLRHPSCLALFL